MKEYAPAVKLGKLALELSKRHIDSGKGAYNSEDGGSDRDAGGDGDVCIQMQLRTMFYFFPYLIDATDNAISVIREYANRLLKSPGSSPVDDRVVLTMPRAAPDPFVHCMNSIFYLSCYHHVDVAAISSKQYGIARLEWPALDF